MSLLGINLGNALPDIASQNPGTIQYTTGTPNGSFAVTTTDITLFQAISPGGVPTLAVDPITPDTGGSAQSIVSILVNSSPLPPSGSGGSATSVPGDDLSVSGMVTVKNPDGSTGATYDGVLLTGEVEQFGFEFDPAQPDGSSPQGVFDFRFQVTGGLLASYFAGQDIGMVVSSVGPDAGPVPPTDFSQSFTYTEPKCNIGPIPKLPSIVTNAIETNGTAVGTATISDSATLSGGNIPGGTISFSLTQPDGTTISEGSVPVSGDGTYLSPVVLTTQVGAYTWHATYSGDGSNPSAVDNGANETVRTVKASPSISTKASENGNVVNAAQLSDSVTVTGGYNPTGTVTFTLTKPDGTTVPAGSVTIAGDGTYTVSPSVLATQVGTYTWHATYAGDSLNNGAVDQGGAAEQLTVVAPPGGTISGTKYNDLTGNGFSADDTPLGGITIDLYQGTSASGTLYRTTVTAANGTYSFSNLPNGTYFVQESVPANSVETGGLLGYVVTVSAGTNSTGNNFDDFQKECDLTKFSCIYYVINGCKTVTGLSGNVQPGDEVTAYFTVAANYSDSVSLVSYITPDNYFNANDANQQVIYDQKTLSFTTGSCAQTFCLGPVQIPLCNYQIDFVCGPAINTFGPAGSNVFYHPQNRIFDSSNGGCQPCSTAGSAISGIVYCDTNLDGKLDCCETLICGATVSLETTGGKVLQTTTTGSNGSYAFENLAPGTYLVVVTPPSGDTAETSNTITVVLPNKLDPQLNPMGNSADLNFAELCHCSAIQGSCWDDTNNDGKIDYNECGVIYVTINLSGIDCLGNKVSLSCKTDNDGDYCFSGLLPGCYTICEGQPGGFTQGYNSCGTVNGSVCGTKSGTDTFCNVQISNCGDAGIGYNFGEHCTTNDCKGACASTSFWKNSNGQALLCKLNGSSNSYALGKWLANTFPDMYSHVLVNGTYVNFANLTNAQIAWFFVNCDYNVYSAKLNTQVLAAAFNCYATSTNLCGGTYASAYGFTTSANGSGYDLINVGSNGAAFGVANYSNISILQALNAADADAVNGNLYATSEVINGVYYSSTTLQNMALTVFTNINNTGGII